MKIRKRFVIILVVLSCGVGCDQATKEVARHALQGAEPISWCHNVVRLHYTENTGAFLGLGATLPDTARFWIFLVAPAVALGGMAVFGGMSSRLERRDLLMLSCAIGGGLSNLIDRLVQDGRVSDFLNIGIGTLRTGVFNVADVLIMLGVGGLLLSSMSAPEERGATAADPASS
ncbi:MAG: signal peptidase II [bacterium]|nr:signal peptidase II [bacterium]